MKQIRISLLQVDIDALDELVKRGLYVNQSDAIRYAVRDLIKLHKNETLHKP